MTFAPATSCTYCVTSLLKKYSPFAILIMGAMVMGTAYSDDNDVPLRTRDLCDLKVTGRLRGMDKETTLTLTVKNTGSAPLIIDNELIVLMHIVFSDDRGRRIEPVRTSKGREAVSLSRDAAKKRFVTLAPGESLVRIITPFSGYRVFEYAVSESDRQFSATGYECSYQLPGDSTIAVAKVSYSVGHGLREGFRAYTNSSLEEWGICEGPSRAVINRE